MSHDTADPLMLLDLDTLLSEAERAFAARTAAVVAEVVRPHVSQWFTAGQAPMRDIAREFGRHGLLGMQLRGWGTAEASPVEYGMSYLEVEAADSGIRSLLSVQGSLAMQAIHDFGSDEQQEQYLPGLAEGSLLGGFALTEAGAGSDPSGMQCRAERVGSDWVLSGTKRWVLNGSQLDVLVAWARTEDGVKGFLVPMALPGVEATVIPDQYSLRIGGASQVTFKDVRLPADAVLEHAKGLGSALRCLNEARFGIVFGPLGAARDALSDTLEYTGARTQFGRPLSGFQLSQTKFVDAASDLSTALAFAVHLGRAKEAGRLRPEQVSLGKRNSCAVGLDIARTCRGMLGANGITADYSPLRHALNLESVATYEGTHEVQTLVVGKALTGHDAFRG